MILIFDKLFHLQFPIIPGGPLDNRAHSNTGDVPPSKVVPPSRVVQQNGGDSPNQTEPGILQKMRLKSAKKMTKNIIDK